VTGVEAQRDVAGVEQPQDRLPALDRRPDVGVQSRQHSRIPHLLLHAVQVAQQNRPLLLADRDLPVVAAVGGAGGEHDDLSAAGRQDVDGGARLAQVRVRICMQRYRHEAADQPHVVRRQEVLDLLRTVSQVSRRA
jgi:hypothetical protein